MADPAEIMLDPHSMTGGQKPPETSENRSRGQNPWPKPGSPLVFCFGRPQVPKFPMTTPIEYLVKPAGVPASIGRLTEPL